MESIPAADVEKAPLSQTGTEQGMQKDGLRSLISFRIAEMWRELGIHTQGLADIQRKLLV